MVLEYHDFVIRLQEEMIRLSDLDKNQLVFLPGNTGRAADCLVVESKSGGRARTRMTFQMQDLFSEGAAGSSVTVIAESILEQMEQIHRLGLDRKGAAMTQYAAIRDQLIIRPLPISAVSAEMHVFRRVGDVALVLYMRLGQHEGNLFTSRIRRDMLSAWGKTEKNVLDEAMENTLSLSAPRLYSLEKMMMEPDYAGDRFMDSEDMPELADTPCGTCLSTVSRVDGAVAPFLPGVSGKLARLMGEDFYIAFTSVHEAMIHRVSLVTPEDLQVVLRETIEETTRGSEFLSFGIYRYYAEYGRIELI